MIPGAAALSAHAIAHAGLRSLATEFGGARPGAVTPPDGQPRLRPDRPRAHRPTRP